MESLSTIETMKAEIKALNKGAEVGGSSSFDRDREAKVEAPKPLMFKGVNDVQEVENFLWHLENYFKCNRVKNDENKINTTMLYVSEMAMVWCRRKESKIESGIAPSKLGSDSKRSSRRHSSLTTSSIR